MIPAQRQKPFSGLGKVLVAVVDNGEIPVQLQVFYRDFHQKPLFDLLMDKIVGKDGNSEIVHHAADQRLGACALPSGGDRPVFGEEQAVYHVPARTSRFPEEKGIGEQVFQRCFFQGR